MTNIEQLHLNAMIVKDLQAAKKSAEITENIACEFAEWLDDTLDKDFVKELFQKYLKSKENETTTNTH